MSYAVCVTFEIVPAQAEAFRARVAEQARASLTEPGCRTFDVWSDQPDGRLFHLHEVYDDRAAFEAHLETGHFAAFDGEVRDWVMSKRIETFARRVAP